MIQRIPGDARVFTCDEHPDLVLDELAAAEHLRTVHSELWSKLAELRVERVPAPPPAQRPRARAHPRPPRQARRARRRR